MLGAAERRVNRGRLPNSACCRALPSRRLRLEVLETRWVLSPAPFVSWGTAGSFAVATDPRATALADLNGDGSLDLITANRVSGSVSVLVNSGSPTAAGPDFLPKQDFACVGNVYDLGVGDFNGDGRPDLVVVNSMTSGSVSVLLNATSPGNSLMSFAARQDFAVGSKPESVAIGDINHDGRLDLVVANSQNYNTSVLLNTTPAGAPTPSFAAKQDFVAGGAGVWNRSVALGDLNGDGKLDMVVANWSGTMSVLRNTTVVNSSVVSFAASQSFNVGSAETYVTLGDLNGDGAVDAVVSSWSNDTVSVLLNTTPAGTTTFTFASPQTIASGGNPHKVTLGDLDGDGRLDLAVPNGRAGTVAVFLNTMAPGATAAGFAPPQESAAGGEPFSLALGDLDGDGKQDLALGNWNTSTAVVLLNATPWGGRLEMSAAPDAAAGTRPDAVKAADFNGDGKADLLVGDTNAASVAVYVNATAPGGLLATWIAPQDFATAAAGYSLDVADFNLDGRPDIVAANYGSNSVSVLLNTTFADSNTLNFALHQDFAATTGPTHVSTGDLNGDGKPDLVLASRGGNAVSVLINATPAGSLTAAFAPRQDFSMPDTPQSVALGDLNGDGKLDLVVGATGSFEVWAALNTMAIGGSSATFSSTVTLEVAGNPMYVTLADINADGRPDIVAALKSADCVAVLRNTTLPGAVAPSFSASVAFPVGDAPQGLCTGDIDLDGRIDIVAANYSTHTVSVLRNSPVVGSLMPTFTDRHDFSTGLFPCKVAAVDVNGDGRVDLATTTSGSHAVSVLLNTSEKLATPTVNVTISGGAYTGQPFAVTDARVTGLPPDGQLATFGDATLSYTYYAQGVPLSGPPINVGDYWVIAHYTSDNPDYADADSLPVSFSITAAVVQRAMFYNNSFFDGRTTGAGAADDNALALDRTALLPGQTGSAIHYTSYVKGLNGVMIDVAGIPAAATLTASDFQFKLGNTSDPSTWAAATAAPSVTVRRGAGSGGTDRIELIWADGAIKHTWLQITVLATANTGLAANDVFYFGNNAGDADGDGNTGYPDLVAIFLHNGQAVAAPNRYDVDGSGSVTFADLFSSFRELRRPALAMIAPPAVAGANSPVALLSAGPRIPLLDQQYAELETLFGSPPSAGTSATLVEATTADAAVAPIDALASHRPTQAQAAIDAALAGVSAWCDAGDDAAEGVSVLGGSRLVTAARPRVPRATRS